MTLRRWLALGSVVALANGGPVQSPTLKLPSRATTYQKEVVDLFERSYTAYKKYAWGHDDLAPLSESFYDDWNGWGRTITDALGTMWPMGRHDWFVEGVNYLANEDFSHPKTNEPVNLYGTTTLEVGGLLSAYELSNKQHDVLVTKAEQAVKQMAHAFTGNNPIPYPNINFTDHTHTSIASAGTLTMEWNRLSLHTHNATYRELAERSVQHLMRLPSVLPGMPARSVDPSSGNSIESYLTWGGGSGSYFEYLIKYARLTNTNDNSYVNAWLTAVDSSINTLLKISTVGNRTYLADYDGRQIVHVGSHYACFAGGNWILGGKLTNNETIVKFGLEITDACWNTCTSTATGIIPSEFGYISSDGNYTNSSLPSAGQIEFYNEHGYYITDPRFLMGPAMVESNFYAWRATGDVKYFNNAVSVLHSFQQYLVAPVGYGSLFDVNDKGAGLIDWTPPWWFGATLKYLYLTFDSPNHISLDDYVFNTEGHPFKAPAAKNVYGSGA